MRSFLSTEIDVTSPSTQLLGICGQFRSTSNLGAFGGDCASSPIDNDATMIKTADAANRKYFTVFVLSTAQNICIAQVSRQRKPNSINVMVELRRNVKPDRRTLAGLVRR